jgi:hypothetical protein
MMRTEYQEALAWLCTELLGECLRSGEFSIVQEFLPILEDQEREQLLHYLFWQALGARKWWLAEDCPANGVFVAPSEVYLDNPLHTATYFCGDCPDVVGWLLDHGAQIERRDLALGNSTPLIHAVGAGLNDVVELLLQRGADVNAHTEVDDDQTALMVAAEAGNERAARLLLANGADVERKDRWGRDAATLAELKGHSELCRLVRESKRGETGTQESAKPGRS